MTRNTSIAHGLALAVLCLSLPAAAADLPKSGKYSGHYGWTFTGQVQKLGEDWVVYAGVVPGVMFNDVNKGRANANGTCVVTDADGDNIFVEWKYSGVMPACPGTERFVGGTSKYTGISGDQKFRVTS